MPPHVRDTQRFAWWHPLALAVAMGSVTGLVHASLVCYRQEVTHVFTWTSRDLMWMSPLGNIAFLVPPALVLTIACFARVRWATWGAAAGLSGLVAAISLLLNVKGLHPYAIAVLATGTALQLARLASGRPGAWHRWVPRVAAVGVAGIAGGFAVTGRSRPAPAGSGATGAPNVVLLILDTVRASSTSLHGYARSTTPVLERVAQEGVVYDRAISPSSWTLPSHAAIFTGRSASTLSASWRRPLDTTHPTLAEVLTREGYTTGAFVANLYYTHYESGITRGFQVVRDFRRSRLQVLRSTTLGQTPIVDQLLWGDHSPGGLLRTVRTFALRARSEPVNDRRRAAEVLDEFLAWQSHTRGPWFAFLNWYDAHDPYEPAPGYETTFAAQPTKQDVYDAGIRYMDDQLGRLVASLQARGVLDNTVLIVTSDHGEQWGEHGLHNHGNSLYLPAVHVPLVMRFPARIAAGRRHSAPVSLTALAATILDATGRGHAALPGASLLGADSTLVITETEALDPSARVRSPAERGPLSSAVRDSLQFIRNGDSTYQLFDIERDPAQATNLLGTSGGCATALVLDSLLRQVSQLPATPALTVDRCHRVPPADGAAREP